MNNNQTKSHPLDNQPCWVIEDAAWVKGFEIKIWFRDGSIKIVNLEERIKSSTGKVFEPLKDPEYFSKVEFNEELGSICWPNEADFSPEYLYENGIEAIPLRDRRKT